MPLSYDPNAWYWNVLDRTPPNVIYDSAAGAYVAATDPGYLAFLADDNPVTVIATDALLQDVLAASAVPYQGQTVPALVEDRPRVARARCRVTDTGETIATGTPTALTFDVENSDPIGMHDPVTNPQRITIVESGLYLVIARVAFLESTAALPGVANVGTRGLQIRSGSGGGAADEGTTRVGAAISQDTEFPVAEFVQLDAGEFLRLFAEQDCGGDMDVQARLSLLRIE